MALNSKICRGFKSKTSRQKKTSASDSAVVDLYFKMLADKHRGRDLWSDFQERKCQRPVVKGAFVFRYRTVMLFTNNRCTMGQ